MLNEIYFKNGHLTPAAFLALLGDRLTLLEKEAFLSHLQSCDDCMKRYLDNLTDDALLIPPDEVTEGVLHKVEIARTVRQKNLWGQVWRLGIAVCLTLVVFFGGTFDAVCNFSQRAIAAGEKSAVQSQKRAEQNQAQFQHLSQGLQKSIGQFFDGLETGLNFQGDGK